MLKNPKNIRYELEKAYYLCNSGRPGPVWIDVPADIQASLIEETKLKKFKKPNDKKNTFKLDSVIKETAILLAKSNKPLIHFGGEQGLVTVVV